MANLFDGDSRRIGDCIPCSGLFMDPALGRVGMTETEALASGKRVLRAKILMQRVGRSREASALGRGGQPAVCQLWNGSAWSAD